MDLNNLRKLLLIFATVVLTACGGGDDGTGTLPEVPIATNAAPIARAGTDQSVVAGTTVTLDASTSTDADGDALTYEWILTSKPADSAASLSSNLIPRPSFVADKEGLYRVRLVVSDGKDSSEPAWVTITGVSSNAAPVANAGTNLESATGAMVMLDGSKSTDANGDPLTYRWGFASTPTGSMAILRDDNTARPGFIPDVEGEYVIGLIVNDGQVDSSAATVMVKATRANAAPIADAGTNQLVNPRTAVALDGSASKDPNGDPLTYRWALTFKPAGSNASLSSTTAVHPNFVADLAGDYVASLVVNDGRVDSEPSTVTVTAGTSSLALFEYGSGPLADTEYPVKWPYAKTHATNVTCVGVCETTLAARKFKLVASGGRSFTITNLKAFNTNTDSKVQAFFSGLSEGQVIPSGKSVTFELRSSWTYEEKVKHRYSFMIKETGQVFDVTLLLRTFNRSE